MFGLTPLIPAYGRDYKSLKAAQADFDAGKGFLGVSGQVVTKNDLAAVGYHAATIPCRSANLRKVWMLSTK